MNDRLRHHDDHAPATKGELRSLEGRIHALEALRAQVSDLGAEVEGIVGGVERHIKTTVPAAVKAALEVELRPYGDKFDKLDRVLEILIEQETRAKIRAEEKAAEDVARAERVAAREHRLKVWAAAAVIIVPLLGLLSAMVGSQLRGSAPTNQSAPK